ncbi:hypothetical protein, partial [Enterobacter sp.]|uniref:hypothetical protein n=1 Tax=Enterobacter sp. TaxID=42895 RepID=UPI00296FE590
AHALNDASLTLNFTGTLSSPTCTAKFDNNATSFNINFGNVKSSDVLASASRAGYLVSNTDYQPVKVKFTACGTSTKFVVGLSSAKNNTDGTNYQNKSLKMFTTTATPAATGLGVAFFKTNKDSSESNTLPTNGSTVSMAFTGNTTGDATNGYVWTTYAGLVVTDIGKLTPTAISGYAGTTLKTDGAINIDYL